MTETTGVKFVKPAPHTNVKLVLYTQVTKCHLHLHIYLSQFYTLLSMIYILSVVSVTKRP